MPNLQSSLVEGIQSPAVNPWAEKVGARKAEQEQARELIQRAGQRRRNAQAELKNARDDLALICDEIAASGILPKAQIADAAGISRSRLYGNTNNQNDNRGDRHVTTG